MTRYLLAGAAMLLIGTSGAWAQSAQTAQSLRPANATSAYGASGVYSTTTDGNLAGVPAYISPSAPGYAFFEPIHRGQASESEAAQSTWAAPYAQLGHDSCN